MEKLKSETDIVVSDCRSWDGTMLPPYPEGEPEISVLKIRIPAHTRLPMHFHPVINAGYVLKGILKVVAEDGASKTFKAGDAIIEMVNKNHYGMNEGDEDVELIMFYAAITEAPTITIPV